ncbi:hypothetical protein Ancab_039653 [Ancistrocladus abbreviatus]
MDNPKQNEHQLQSNLYALNYELQEITHLKLETEQQIQELQMQVTQAEQHLINLKQQLSHLNITLQDLEIEHLQHELEIDETEEALLKCHESFLHETTDDSSDD